MRCVDKACNDGPPEDDQPRPRWATDGLLCKRCAGMLERRLAELPARADQLRSVLGGSTGGGRGENRPTKGHPPLPLNVTVHDHLQAIHGTLTSWALLVAEERSLVGPPRQTVPGLSAWLLGHVSWLVGQAWVDDLAEELRDLSRVADGLTRVNPAWHRLEPPCPTEDCGAHELYRRDGESAVVCGACGRTWDEQHYAWLSRLAADSLSLTARQAAERLGVPPGTFRRWVGEGKIRRVGTVDGLARYAAHDVDAMGEEGAA